MYKFVLQHALQGIPGLRSISDDIIVFGKTRADHDRSLDQTLQRLCDRGLTLNKDKCLFSVPELVFFGIKISAAGLYSDDKKVKAIQNAQAPINVGGGGGPKLPWFCQLLCTFHFKFCNRI